MITGYKVKITTLAAELLYSRAEITAAFDFFDRKNHRSDPPGKFDNAKRFYADERSEAVKNCRAPSRAYPNSEMRAARTARHCAEIHGVDCVTHVRRVARALEKLAGCGTEEAVRKLLV